MTNAPPTEEVTIVSPEQFASPATDNRWMDEKLAHDSQRRCYKAVLFWTASTICLLLYMIFFAFLWIFFTDTVFMQIFLEHKHITGLALALVLVPSAILWGLVRAIFKVDPSSQNYGDVLKEGIKIHPFS